MQMLSESQSTYKNERLSFLKEQYKLEIKKGQTPNALKTEAYSFKTFLQN